MKESILYRKKSTPRPILKSNIMRRTAMRCRKYFIISTFLLIPFPVYSQVTFSSALPVTKREGILRLQSKYIRSTGDLSTQGRELNAWVFPIVGVYGVTEKIAFFANLPIFHRDLESNTAMGRIKRDASGLGDMNFLVRYTIFQWDQLGQTLRIAPFVGLEVPTGDDNKVDNFGPLPKSLQLGSGSWDPSLGTAFTWQTLNWELDAAASYKFNTVAHNFEFGDVARFNTAYKYRIWPFQLEGGVPGFIYVGLESNLIWQDKNQSFGLADPNSGGITWYLAPILQYVKKRFVIEGAIQLPAVQDLNGLALKNDFITTLSFRVNF